MTSSGSVACRRRLGTCAPSDSLLRLASRLGEAPGRRGGAVDVGARQDGFRPRHHLLLWLLLQPCSFIVGRPAGHARRQPRGRRSSAHPQEQVRLRERDAAHPRVHLLHAHGAASQLPSRPGGARASSPRCSCSQRQRWLGSGSSAARRPWPERRMPAHGTRPVVFLARAAAA